SAKEKKSAADSFLGVAERSKTNDRSALGLRRCAGSRRRRRWRANAERRDQAAADQSGTERDVIRLARSQTRKIKCHRVRQGGPDTWNWRWPNVAGRRFADCCLESERGRAFA